MLPPHLKMYLSPLSTEVVELETPPAEIEIEFDRVFNIPESRKYAKYVKYFVDIRSIELFAHYVFWANRAEPGREYSANVHPEQVHGDGGIAGYPCYVGRDIERPIEVNLKKIKRNSIWSIQQDIQPAYIIVSKYIRQLLEDSGATGLEYFPCSNSDENYLAKIISYHAESADDIHVSNYACRNHRVVSGPWTFNLRIVSSELEPIDFQAIDSVSVKGDLYYYQVPTVIVTQRTLRLLHSAKIRGIIQTGLYGHTGMFWIAPNIQPV